MPARHYYSDLTVYDKFSCKQFLQFCQKQNLDTSKTSCCAFLPGYVERGTSSLVWMIQNFIDTLFHGRGKVCSSMESLVSYIDQNSLQEDSHVILWGVTHALLQCDVKKLPDTRDWTIIVTGGMKGHGSELTLAEVLPVLKEKFGVEKVFSEYGMTELFSQAYSDGTELFYPPNHLQVFVRDITDPFSPFMYNKIGQLCFIDLCNIQSCAFIQSEDVGICYDNGSFEIRGRLDNSELRGCNMLVS
jgi:hypothetical protein